jgi:hypothetical protein
MEVFVCQSNGREGVLLPDVVQGRPLACWLGGLVGRPGRGAAALQGARRGVGRGGEVAASLRRAWGRVAARSGAAWPREEEGWGEKENRKEKRKKKKENRKKGKSRKRIRKGI